MGELQPNYTPHELASQRVNYLRFLNHETQKELAIRVGMSPVQLNKKMNGVSRWAVEDLISIADHYEVDLNYMIGRRPIESATPMKHKTPRRSSDGGFG